MFPDDITTLEEKLAWLDADVEDERVLALVPWADLLNHSSAASERSILQYDETNDAATCFAHKCAVACRFLTLCAGVCGLIKRLCCCLMLTHCWQQRV